MFSIETLARFQFGQTTIFHFFFVPFSIGMSLMVLIMEALYVKTGDEQYKKHTKFWGKIMLLSFAVGVVTGIIQEFQFGMNWSNYSRFVGDIFGAPLAVEALLAFFMESTFLGLWMFTWEKFSKKLHLLCIALVTIGSMCSAFWILAANSFMQHPPKKSYEVVDGHAILTSFSALITNPQTWYEFTHVIAAAIAMGGMLVAGMSAWQLVNKRSTEFYKKSLRLGLVVLTIGSFAGIVAGDQQAGALVDEQPMKFAAMEGVYEDTGSPAAWDAVAFFNEKEHKKVAGIEIPYMLSILTYHKTEGAVEGMNTVNKKLLEMYGKDNYYPAVTAVFWSFRVMAGFGMLMFGIGVLGLIFTSKKFPLVYKHKWMQYIIGVCTFVPFIANTAGWLITELGRYPWTVYGLFKIKDSVSPNVSVTSLLISNIVYFLLFATLGSVMIFLTRNELKKGPDYTEKELASASTTSVDPFDKGAFSHE
ncbi:MAG: cytochrome ubiquinol oxidase subunit I [Lactobacillales bacterium]|jgi:cytochrome d ubiquinol oxidase subunit I|nr:cytochrome ubiquinol oxidase subunit I [Lactobacillales bacterium]